MVGNAAQTHAQYGGNVVFQGVPCPNLGIALDTGVAGAADREGAAIGIVFLDSLVGQLAHQVAHHRLHGTDGTALPLKEDPGVLVHKAVVFTIVVPQGAAAVAQQGILEILFPMDSGGFPGKVHKQAGAAPPGSHRQSILAGVIL